MSSNTAEIHKDALQKLALFDENRPVFMMNYLKYKTIVSATGKTGKETYAAYLEATIPFFKQIDADIILKVKPSEILIGDKNEALWDEVLIVKYANKNEFLKLIGMKDYPAALRASALSDSKLIFCE